MTNLPGTFFARKEHVLDDAAEAILTRMSDLGGGYRQIFDDLVINDTPAPTVDGPAGEPVKVNEAGYGAALQNPDPAFRARYYNALLGLYGGHINTLASNYYGKVKADVYLAKSRKYPSARRCRAERKPHPGGSVRQLGIHRGGPTRSLYKSMLA